MRLLLLALLFAAASPGVFAQQTVTFTGVVKDKTGETIIGASVLEKGTTNGCITDLDGNFTLKVSPNATLIVSYVGFTKQEVAVKGRNKADILLEDDTQALDEVVVVGYGVQKKTDLTGSVGSVSSDRIASVGTSSVMGALQGASPGVDITTNSTRPGGSFSIQVRGQNSLNKGNPLYVVDGVVVDDIDFLNPSDIERIDVLKDASSTAIYGSRGSNGVVMVQTKSAGSAKSRLSVSYDGYYGVRNIARVPDFMDGREWMDYRTSRFYTWNAGANAYELTNANQIAISQNSKLVHTALYNQDYTDWLDLGTQSGSQQNHYVNISGMGGDMTYNIGAGYQKEEGNFVLEEMNKYILKASVNHKANKFFSTGAGVTMSHQVINTGSEFGYRDLMRLPNILKAYRENGEMIEQPGIKAEIEGDGNFTSSSNPLLEIAAGSNESRRFDILGNAFVEFTPLSGVVLKSTFSPRLNRTRNGLYRGVVSGNRSVNAAQNENKETFDWTWDNVANFNKRFAQKHNVNLTLIHSVYKSQYEALKLFAQNFPYDSQWYNILKGTLVNASSEANYTQITMLSYAARANYDYAGKYLITGTVRYDGSSKLADKWAAFPSAALAWRVSEEEFMKKFDWLSNLKARLSLGYSGSNNGVSAYGTQTAPSTSSNVYYDFGGTMVSGYATGSPVNPTLTWEKTREWNLGFDFGLWGGRIDGSIDLYDKLSDGLLMKRTLAFESGVKDMTDNIGSVNNRGIEIALNTLNFQTKDWEWRTTFTFAANKNAIRSLYGKKEDVVSEARFIGKSINVIYDYKVNGVYSQAEWAAMTAEQRAKMGALQPGYAKAVDTDGNEEMSTADKIILGSSDPDWTGSFTSTLKYRQFDLSFNIYTRQGVFLSDYFLEEFNGAANSQRGRPKVNFDYYVPGGLPRYDWTQPFTIDANGQAWAVWGTSVENANAKYPVNSMTGNFYGDNGKYQTGSFVKVRNITLGYMVPKVWAQKAKLASARLYMNVLNPFTFTNYVGWDPEFAGTTLQNGNGPSTITYQFGVNLKF